MRVGLDISALSVDFKEHALRGIGRYAFELQKQLENIQSSKVSVKSFRHADLSVPAWLDSVINKLPAGRHTIRQQVAFPLFLGNKTKKIFDVLHFLAQTDAPSWCPMPYIVTVHDIIPLVLGDLYKANNASWRWHLARWLELKAIRNAAHICTVSNHSKNDLVRVLNIDPNKISVTYNGMSEVFFSQATKSPSQIRSQFNIPLERDIILYVGGIDPRKNALGLISIYEKACALTVNKDMPLLVIAGKIKADRQYPKLVQAINTSPYKSNIIELGYVSDEDLVSLFNTTSVFAFPSLYEGFGLPPLEACAAGVAVVSSDRSSLPEILGSAAVLCDPEDHDRFSHLIVSILSDRNFANHYKEKGPAQAKKFSWQDTAKKTFEVYENFKIRP